MTTLLENIQETYWIMGTEPPASINEDAERYNIGTLFKRENTKLLSGYNWIFAKVKTRLKAATDEDINRYALSEGLKQYERYFRFPILNDGKGHPENGAFLRLVAIYLPSLEYNAQGNLMEMDKELRETITWERYGHGFFIDRNNDDEVIIDYIPNEPEFENDGLGRVYSENYLSAVQYQTAAVALDRVFPDPARKQSALIMKEQYLKMAISSDTRVVRPIIKKTSFELPHTKKWIRNRY